MRSVNKVVLIGNLTRDPVLKQTENGQPVCTFGMATNREWRTRNGDRKSLAEFHNIVAWSKLAEKCYKYLKKGKLIYVEGYLKTRVFDNDDGTKNFRTEVVIYDMIMLDRKGAEMSDDDYDDENSPMYETMQAEDEGDTASDSDYTASDDTNEEKPKASPISSIEDSIDNL